MNEMLQRMIVGWNTYTAIRVPTDAMVNRMNLGIAASLDAKAIWENGIDEAIK